MVEIVEHMTLQYLRISQHCLFALRVNRQFAVVMTDVVIF